MMNVPTLALLSSPLLGPAVWQPVAQVLADRGWHSVTCAMTAPVRTAQDALDAFCTQLPEKQDLVLVPHSNAGAYVPALALQRRVVAAIFVDAALPPLDGEVPLVPPAFLNFLRTQADQDGVLPVWTRWWDEGEAATLFPDARTRERVEREQHRLPLSYFEGMLSVPPSWDEFPAAYLAFGDTYAGERAEAVRRSWPVRTLPGGHLHQLADPDRVATELVALIGCVGIMSPN